jgi:hypothetical protein
MNSVQTADAASATPTPSSLVRWAGWMSILQGLLIFIPTIVLGGAINWPDSLDDPASIALPRILENEGAVRLGYVGYLAYSVLFAVTMLLLLRFAERRRDIGVGSLVAAFAIASTVARCIGIVRWLAPVPVLAEAYVATSDEAERTAISAAFDALNSFGGTIGEVLGVGIFASLSIGLFSIAALKTRVLPAWLGVFGLVSAVSVLAIAVELLGVDPGAVVATLGTSLVQFWFLAIGIWLLLRGSRPLRPADADSAG